MAYWDERPRAAVELAADGWRYVPEIGTARVRLASIEARAHARLRDQRATEKALARAEQARSEVRGSDDPGGMLAFPLAKQSFYAATARLWLGGPDSYTDAERDAAHAIERVLAIAAQRRTDSVARRLHQVGRALQRPRYQTSTLALDLHDQIRSFTRPSAPPALPGASR